VSDYFVHPKGLCETAKVGPGTRIWAFAHVLAGATIGRDCNVCDHTFIENDVVVGDRVTIKCGVHLWDGVRLDDDVFVGPGVAFTNDDFPRSKQRPDAFLETRVCSRASLGANATLLPGITIGQNAMVGAGAVVTRNVPPNAIVVGNPARIVGYVDGSEPRSLAPTPPAAAGPIETVTASRVRGVTSHRLRMAKDLRGQLSAGEFPTDIPFLPKRYFLVFEVPTAEVRGEHAHRVCEQFLVCVAGSCSVVADDGTHREELRLDSPSLGVYLPAMTWATQYKYSADAVLLVFASHVYDPDDYIRKYADYLAALGMRAG
jgi:acetyltransferase-like isoleucine patch superfamily enzyme